MTWRWISCRACSLWQLRFPSWCFKSDSSLIARSLSSVSLASCSYWLVLMYLTYKALCRPTRIRQKHNTDCHNEHLWVNPCIPNRISDTHSFLAASCYRRSSGWYPINDYGSTAYSGQQIMQVPIARTQPISYIAQVVYRVHSYLCCLNTRGLSFDLSIEQEVLECQCKSWRADSTLRYS